MRNEFGEKLDHNRYAHSILQDNVGEQCFLCRQEHCELVRHEIYSGNPRRRLCKEYGLWITICPSCHARLHANPASAESVNLKEYAQRKAMEVNGWDTVDFIAVIGKSYV